MTTAPRIEDLFKPKKKPGPGRKASPKGGSLAEQAVQRKKALRDTRNQEAAQHLKEHMEGRVYSIMLLLR
jgi:hypothetical protein